METRANYFLVGIFVITTITLFFLFLVWVAGGFGKQDHTRVLIYFPGSISGLSDGSPVRYRGVQVGTVTDIILDPNDPDEVHVLVDVQANTPLREGMRADLQMLGITGLAFIDLSSPADVNASALRAKPGQRYPVIEGNESTLERVMTQMPELIDRYTQVAEDLNNVLNAQNQQAFAEVLQNLEGATASLDNFSQTGLPELEMLLSDARAATHNLSELSQKLNDEPSQFLFQPEYEGYRIK